MRDDDVTGGVQPRLNARQRTHLDGVLAGSSLVVALYLAVAVPAQFAQALAAPSWASVLFLVVVAVLTVGGVFAAKSWHARDQAPG